jgi:hypothetical protein
MKVEVEADGTLLLKEVVKRMDFKSKEGELFSLKMVNGGYEFSYQGETYLASGGKMTKKYPIVEERNEMLE